MFIFCRLHLKLSIGPHSTIYLHGEALLFIFRSVWGYAAMDFIIWRRLNSYLLVRNETIYFLNVQINIVRFETTSKDTSIKNVRTKSRKIDLFPLVRKISALVQPPPPLSMRTRRAVNFEKSEVFCTNNCGRPHLIKNPHPSLSEKCPHWTTLS